MILKGYLFSLLYAVAVLTLGTVAYKAGMPRRYSRKLVHVLVGFEWFILSYYHAGSFHFVAVCLFFLFILYLVYRTGWMPMMSSEGDNAPGTVYYALAMSILAAVSALVPDFMNCFGIGVLVTSLGDGFGGVLGQLISKNPRIYRSKTVVGTLSVFAFSLVSVFAFSHLYRVDLSFLDAMAIALLATGVELLSTRGVDNLLMPLFSSAFSYLLLYSTQIREMRFALASVPLLVALTVGKRKLTVGGAAMAVGLDVLVALAFGDGGFAVLITFFALALVCDQIKRLGSTQKKRTECRTCRQVLSNALFGATGALSYLFFSHPIFLFIFVASFAEALGDTASSGFGAIAKGAFDPFRMRRVEKGESGGTSLLGTLAGLFFAFALVALGGLLFRYSMKITLLLFLAATAGIVADSCLGSLVQMKYVCKVCRRLVEEPMHCDTPTERIRGIRPFDNSFVNLISGAICVLFVVLIFFLL